MLRLGPLVAHLWYAWPDAIVDADLLARYQALLAPEERARWAAFHFPAGRHEYLVTRALVRAVLSEYAPDVAPVAWTFQRNAHGRPEIAGPGDVGPLSRGPGDAPALRFNLSNTDGLIVCLVSDGLEIGVDVENTSRAGETVGLADQFFSPTEARALRALPEARQRDRFFDYWTLKEAYIKARGMGLAIPLERFSFAVDVEPIGIAFAPELVDDPRAWQFTLASPTPRHRLATAIRAPLATGRVAIESRTLVPLASRG